MIEAETLPFDAVRWSGPRSVGAFMASAVQPSLDVEEASSPLLEYLVPDPRPVTNLWLLRVDVSLEVLFVRGARDDPEHDLFPGPLEVREYFPAREGLS